MNVHRAASRLHAQSRSAASGRGRAWARLVVLVLILASACSSSNGLRVDVDMTSMFEGAVETLRLTLAVSGGFKGANPSPPGARVELSYPGNGDLVMVFARSKGFTFTQRFSFLLETGNTHDVDVSADAVGFDGASKKIASARVTHLTLPAGGEARLALTLAPDSDGTTIDTTLVDLATAMPDRIVKGSSMNAPLATVAVCRLGGSGNLVIGVPAADQSTAVPATGAVYIVFDGTDAVDLAAPAVDQEVHFFGVNSGDRLGAAIACFDFDKDGSDDLVIGAPGAFGLHGEEGAGRVYVLRARSNLKNGAIDLSQHQAELEWVGGAAGAHLGEHLLAADLQGGTHGEILIAAPGEGSGVVHLVSVGDFAGTPATPEVLSGTAGHVTFSGIQPEAMAVGDLDGDGVVARGSEVVFGDPSAFSATAPTLRVGAVHVFKDVDPSATTSFDLAAIGALGPILRREGAADNDGFGATLLALDVAGQGADLIVGAPGESNGAGAIRIFEHQSDFTSVARAAKWTYPGAAAGDRFGSTLASGSAAVAESAALRVGAPAAASGDKAAAGAVYSYKRLSTGAEPIFIEKLLGAAAMDRLGTAIAAGPIGSNDLVTDLLVLAPGAFGAEARSGVAYVRLAH